ncbi:hypothetical protein EFP84_00210 [Leptospira kmetyi]|uniref:HNH endonuclease n=1 Tax=Leptospira kmetyi TaxID=408139 RepID=A0AAD0UKF0_9LEPT|nr:hypothetical protein [Leptospira kmetyi]AYV54081.1 hypothetical protein EFP84_00210 [Leptospira kmetyi]
MKKKVLNGEIPYKFKAEHFKSILSKQDFKCYLSGRTLTEENVNGAHITPLNKTGEHKLENICLVIDQLKQLKRYYTDEEIVYLAVDIVNSIGKEYGFSIKKLR